MKKYSLIIFAITFSLYSCDSSTEKQNDTPAGDSAVASPAVLVEQIWSTDTIFKSSESVLYDKLRNVIYVSCINGMPADIDGNGYISKITPEGKIDNLEWIKGLNAPKGLGIFGNTLYVTDVTKLIEIDIEKGVIKKSYNVPGAIFLNDINVDSAGTVYFTDSEANKIHTLKEGEISTWLDKDLNKPNGVLIENNRLLIAFFGGMDFKAFDLTTKAITPIANEIGAGDGVVYFGKAGHYLVSDWYGTVNLIEPDGSKNLVLDTKSAKANAADIDFIQESSLLIVPTFFDNRVVAYKVTHLED